MHVWGDVWGGDWNPKKVEFAEVELEDDVGKRLKRVLSGLERKCEQVNESQ